MPIPHCSRGNILPVNDAGTGPTVICPRPIELTNHCFAADKSNHTGAAKGKLKNIAFQITVFHQRQDMLKTAPTMTPTKLTNAMNQLGFFGNSTSSLIKNL